MRYAISLSILTLILSCQSTVAPAGETTGTASILDSNRAKALYQSFADSIAELEYESAEPRLSGVHDFESFQIITMDAKVCNRLCDQIYRAFLYDKTKGHTLEMPFKTITAVQSFQGQYILLDSGIAYAQTYTATIRDAYALQVIDGQVHWSTFDIPFDWSDPESLTMPAEKFSIEQQNVFDTPSSLTFDRDNNLLKFAFQHDYRVCCDEDSAFACSGQYRLEHEQFILEHYEAHGIK